MRLTDSDRERLFEQLSRHAAADALSLDELERRVEAVAAARTREEAVALVADLPRLADEDASPERARGRRGHGHADAPAVDWHPTGERFRDPRTNEVMRVWEDAAGARHYVPDD